MAKFSIYVVEDDEWYRELLAHNLSLNPDYEIRKFDTAKSFLEELGKNPDVVTLDYRLPDMEGEEVLKRIKNYNPAIEVIIISEQEKIETAVNLLNLGAYDYIVKSRDIRDKLLNTVSNIKKQSHLQAKVATLQKEVQKKYSFTNSIIGSSNSIKKVFTLIEKAIGNNISVTITGETGTGKELAAKAIHYNSPRRNFPFVAVNVVAIPKDLIESELFGHEKGAFTGANFRRIGKFEEADKGTLFLDEIGEMDLTIQAKLLRALQEKEVTRIGSNKVVKTDCRIIVATHKNLLQEVKEGRFREDLYYRLFGLTIEMPPLRMRDKDIIILAKHFIQAFCKENKQEVAVLTNKAQKKLLNYSFPGNVRELKSIVELATVMSNNNEITEDDINFSNNEELYAPPISGMTLKEHTTRIIKLYLKKHENNIKDAAKELDIGYSTIYRVLRNEKVDSDE
ncbi:sigma-54-dependent Fis family transcriptional regulator [Fulvivirga sp. 29W222]|uniref:Sigma-54-dependent Fis family transcriptional regulator n=1 Tax=Fulvivirga marina TaxID=2494733 RepID=A0A937FYS7_9BACT|nr:sigma-54 dependent transcriptional regulator [Fulvivirga marina]MBL6447297.1 sigma-54-dependent Fis family transcriptional regulator [Fulvivirga marina]